VHFIVGIYASRKRRAKTRSEIGDPFDFVDPSMDRSESIGASGRSEIIESVVAVAQLSVAEKPRFSNLLA